MPRAELHAWAESRGLALPDDAWARLETLVQLWGRYGRAFNLLGDLSREARVEHVREGLMARLVAERAAGPGAAVRWIDVGTGAGVPGLVIAATTPWPLLLVEPRARRAAFVELACATLGRSDAVVSRARIERATWHQDIVIGDFLADESSIPVASARAVLGPSAWLVLAGSGLPPRGIVLCHVASGHAIVGAPSPITREGDGRHDVVAYRAADLRDFAQVDAPRGVPEKNEEA